MAQYQPHPQQLPAAWETARVPAVHFLRTAQKQFTKTGVLAPRLVVLSPPHPLILDLSWGSQEDRQALMTEVCDLALKHGGLFLFLGLSSRTPASPPQTTQTIFAGVYECLPRPTLRACYILPFRQHHGHVHFATLREESPEHLSYLLAPSPEYPIVGTA